MFVRALHNMFWWDKALSPNKLDGLGHFSVNCVDYSSWNGERKELNWGFLKSQVSESFSFDIGGRVMYHNICMNKSIWGIDENWKPNVVSAQAG